MQKLYINDKLVGEVSNVEIEQGPPILYPYHHQRAFDDQITSGIIRESLYMTQKQRQLFKSVTISGLTYK